MSYTLTYDELSSVCELAFSHLYFSKTVSAPTTNKSTIEMRAAVNMRVASALVVYSTGADRQGAFDALDTDIQANTASICDTLESFYDDFFSASITNTEIRTAFGAAIDLVRLQPMQSINFDTDALISYFDDTLRTVDGVGLADVCSIPTLPFPPFSDVPEEP